MSNTDQQRGHKKAPAHRSGGEDARKQHAPSRHEDPGHHRRGAHHDEQRPPEKSETDWPEPLRSPAEELRPETAQD